MIDLQSLTTVVSVQIDSADRLRNLELFLRYFESFFVNYEIIVVEQDSTSKLDHLLEDRRGVVHHFLESDICHSRGRNLNQGARLSERKHLHLSDIDCFVPPSAIEQGLSQLSTGFDFVLPFNGITVQILSRAIREDLDFKILLEKLPYFPKLYEIRPPKYNSVEFEPMYGTMFWNTTGGAMLCRRKEFFLAGAFNENFLSYGGEDEEFYHRIHKLGYKCDRIDGMNLFHFEHVRNLSSTKNNFYRWHMNELERVRDMDAQELRLYVNRGFRMLKAQPEYDIEFQNTEDAFSISLHKHNRLSRSEICTVLAFQTINLDLIEQAEKLLDLLEEKFDDYSIVILGGSNQQLGRVSARKYTRHCPCTGRVSNMSDAQISELVHSNRPHLEIVRIDGATAPADVFVKLENGAYNAAAESPSGYRSYK